jgi:hypothetical protein
VQAALDRAEEIHAQSALLVSEQAARELASAAL